MIQRDMNPSIQRGELNSSKRHVQKSSRKEENNESPQLQHRPLPSPFATRQNGFEEPTRGGRLRVGKTIMEHRHQQPSSSNQNGEIDSPTKRAQAMIQGQEEKFKDNIIDMLSTKYSKCVVELEKLQKEQDRHDEQLNQSNHEKESYKLKSETLQQQLNNLQGQYDSDISAWKNKHQHLDRRLSLSTAEISQLEQKHSATLRENFRMKAEYEQCISHLQDTLTSKDSQLNQLVTALQNEIKQLSKEALEFKPEIQRLKQDNSRLQEYLEHAKACNLGLQHDMVREGEKEKHYKERIDAMEQSIKKMECKNKKLCELLEEEHKRFTTLQEEYQRVSTSLTTAQEKSTSMEKQINEARTLKKQLSSHTQHHKTKLATIENALQRSQQRGLEMEKIIEKLKKDKEDMTHKFRALNEKCLYLEKVLDSNVSLPTDSMLLPEQHKIDETWATQTPPLKAHPTHAIVQDASRHPDSDAPNWLRY